AIYRLDKLSRNDDVREKLAHTDWDLIVCDEAHKMSATYFGSEVKYTKRYRLGQLLSTLTRHFLLLTATPHNGKEADFQLFMALLDGDRFVGTGVSSPPGSTFFPLRPFLAGFSAGASLGRGGAANAEADRALTRETGISSCLGPVSCFQNARANPPTSGRGP